MKSFRKQFLCIFAISLVATLLLCPGKYSVPGRIRDNFSPVEVQAEEPTITDTQKGVALLMTILFAQGLRFVGDWNTVVHPGIEKLWNDFTTATGNAVTLPMIVAGSSLALGYIRTSNTVNNAIANFTSWYKQTFSQPTTGETNIPISAPNYVSFPNNVCTYVGSNGSNTAYYAWIQSADGDIRCISAYSNSNPSRRNLYFMRKVLSGNSTYFGKPDSSCVVGSSGTSSWTLAKTVNGVNYVYGSLPLYYNMSGYHTFNNVFEAPYYEVNMSDKTQSQQFDFIYEHTFGSSAIGDVSMTGESLELKDGYQLEQDQAKLYDISSLVALVAELALTLDNIEDLVRDIPVIFDTPWAEDFPDVPAYVDTPDDTIPWVTVPDSVIPADTPEYVPTTPGETDSYKILGLERVFPFSIPFDLYYLTQIFVATPETPHFTYAIMNPATNQLLTQEFDLHWFDTLAAVIRTGETVAFLIFLIFVTRGLIRS